MTSNMYRIGGKSQFHHSNIYLQFIRIAIFDCHTHDCNGCSKIDSLEIDSLIYGKLLVWPAECVRDMCNVNYFMSPRGKEYELLLLFLFFSLARCHLISLVWMCRVPTKRPCMWIHNEQQFNDQKCTVHTQQPRNRSFWFVKYIPSPDYFLPCSSIRFSMNDERTATSLIVVIFA